MALGMFISLSDISEVSFLSTDWHVIKGLGWIFRDGI